MDHLRLELAGEKQHGPCACCGQMTSRVWGYVYEQEAGIAAYFVHWNPGHDEGTTAFDLILGKWGEGSSASDRVGVALNFRKLETGPAFMVVDAATRAAAASSLASQSLSREQVLSSPIKNDVFACADIIYADDPRLAHLRR